MSDQADAPNYFSAIPSWPEFAITNDEVSGRVPVTKVASWRALSGILEEEFFNRRDEELIYRGQRRYEWPLSPSLGREDARRIVTRDVAEVQLEHFRKAVRGRLEDHALVEVEEEYELWAVGQHYGLETPLLDWSYSPYVALFFAFEREDRSPEASNPYRAIFLLNKTHVEAEDRCPGVSILEPRKDDHGRLVNQAGLFTYSNYGETLEASLINSLTEEVLGDFLEGEEASTLARYICKIYIPNEDRVSCLRHLRLMNVHHASLFPDLIGAAQYCNELVAEYAAQAKAESKSAAVDLASIQLDRAEAEQGPIPRDVEGRILESLKSSKYSREVEAPRLAQIASELTTEIEKHKSVDWEKRDSIKASMRNAARTVLRRLGYPAAGREEVLDSLFKVLVGNR
jgi:Domain of unknown function (DUF3387)./FRG domain.